MCFMWIWEQTAIISLYNINCLVLDAFAVISFAMSVIEKLDSGWTDFHEILYMSIFRKSVVKSQVLLKSDKNSGTAFHMKA
jgi:hypothetical protein